MGQSTQKVSLLEKIGYSLGDLAANLVFQTLITYLAFFLFSSPFLKTAFLLSRRAIIFQNGCPGAKLGDVFTEKEE